VPGNDLKKIVNLTEGSESFPSKPSSFPLRRLCHDSSSRPSPVKRGASRDPEVLVIVLFPFAVFRPQPLVGSPVSSLRSDPTLSERVPGFWIPDLAKNCIARPESQGCCLRHNLEGGNPEKIALEIPDVPLKTGHDSRNSLSHQLIILNIKNRGRRPRPHKLDKSR
jgi:hypothetical protein